MNTTERYVLGAPDPEMSRIEEILAENCLPFVHATQPNGERADPRTAYNSDPRTFALPSVNLVLVEAGFASNSSVNITDTIDHHNPGDPGYDADPKDSWHASSLGQLMHRLNLVPTEDDMLLGATDHNFAATVNGLVEGVDPELALRYKATGIAKTHGGTTEDVLREVSMYQATIANGGLVDIANGASVVDLRLVDIGEGTTTEYLAIQTAAAKLNVPVMVQSSNGPDSPGKIVLTGSVNEDTVRAFMTEWGPQNGLTDMYGVPSRGYGGGYIDNARIDV